MEQRTITLNEWEKNFIISTITDSWLRQKANLEIFRKEAIDRKNDKLEWSIIRVNDKILEFNLVEGLLAKLTGTEPNLEELIDEEVEE